MQAVDDNHTSDWSILADYIAEDFVAHNPPIPGVSLDREGMKHAAEIFRLATPGRHEIPMQVAEDDLVVKILPGPTRRDQTAGTLGGNRPLRPTGFLLSARALQSAPL